MLISISFCSGCDLGGRDLQTAHGPALHLVASFPVDGQGTNAVSGALLGCDSPTPDCPVATDVPIELRFDRFLLPSGGLASGALLYTGNSRTNRVALRVEYDVVERVVVLRHSRLLEPNALYTVEVVPGADRSSGFWAFDGAPLEEGAVPLRFSFSTGSGPSAAAPRPVPASESCSTMLAGPLRSCAGCHSNRGASSPLMGLDLSSERGLRETAIGHVAHETETAEAIGAEGLQTPARFGVQMNIIDPGNPATSYLLYKLLANPDNFQTLDADAGCMAGYHVPVADVSCTPPDPAEVSRLGDWFLLGNAMPKEGPALDGDALPRSLTRQELRRTSAWIAAGAHCTLP